MLVEFQATFRWPPKLEQTEAVYFNPLHVIAVSSLVHEREGVRDWCRIDVNANDPDGGFVSYYVKANAGVVAQQMTDPPYAQLVGIATNIALEVAHHLRR